MITLAVTKVSKYYGITALREVRKLLDINNDCKVRVAIGKKSLKHTKRLYYNCETNESSFEFLGNHGYPDSTLITTLNSHGEGSKLIVRGKFSVR